MTPAHAFTIHGIVPIIPTPFHRDETIDWEQLPRLIDFAHAAGACAACLPAYGSEFYKLSESERVQLVREAARHSAARIPIIGQVNYPSARMAANMATILQREGANAIGVTVPRLFPLTEHDLYRYFDTVLRVIDVPVIVQDFNPGGQSVSPRFVADLNRAYPQFRFIKLEEPAMSGRVKAILQETEGEVGVIEGWGGMYVLELLQVGICGVMPGLALTDLLARLFKLASGGQRHEAAEIFEGILPQIVFSLQNLELYHHAEKRLLQARGILRESHVREACIELSQDDECHLDFLNQRIAALLRRLDLPLNPLVTA